MSDKYGLQTSDDWYREHADEVIDGGALGVLFVSFLLGFGWC